MECSRCWLMRCLSWIIMLVSISRNHLFPCCTTSQRLLGKATGTGMSSIVSKMLPMALRRGMRLFLIPACRHRPSSKRCLHLEQSHRCWPRLSSIDIPFRNSSPAIGKLHETEGDIHLKIIIAQIVHEMYDSWHSIWIYRKTRLMTHWT
ncbi:hypothetical protein C8J56DRAFT_921076, partial [Mycena floridula]